MPPPKLVRATETWRDANYTKRVAITIQHANIDGNLTNFPVLVKLTDTQAIAKADIASKRYDFYDHNGTRLAFEEETYSEGASYANFEDWVSVPDLYTSPSGSQNNIWLYYGYDYGSDRDDPTSVWASDFHGVWHLDGANATACVDSTANGNDVFADGGTPVYEATGLINKGVGFDAAADLLSMPDDDTLDFATGGMSIETWFKPTSFWVVPFVEKYAAGGYQYSFVGWGGAMAFLVVGNGGGIYQGRTGGAPTNGVWNHLAVSYAGGAGGATDIKIYVNGVQTDTTTLYDNAFTTMNIGTSSLTMAGSSIFVGGAMDGVVDTTCIRYTLLAGALT